MNFSIKVRSRKLSLSESETRAEPRPLLSALRVLFADPARSLARITTLCYTKLFDSCGLFLPSSTSHPLAMAAPQDAWSSHIWTEQTLM